MRTLVCVLALTCLAPPALARTDDGFEANYRSEASGSIEIGQIAFSDLVRTKADSFGEAELARLSDYLRDDLERALINADWHGVAARETVLTVTIVDVVPNRPTMQQIQNVEGAHYSAHADGGAELNAELHGADGTLIGSFSYRWFNPGSGEGDSYGVWTDTRIVFGRFAASLADSLGVAPMPRS